MIKVKDLRDGKGSKIYEDEKTEKRYRTVIASFSWPRSKPGYLVIGALDIKDDPDIKKPSIYILKDKGVRTTHEMLRGVDDYKSVFQFQTVYLDNRSRAVVKTISDFREKKNKEGGSVNWGVSRVPLLDDPKCLEHYIDKIQERMSTGTLFFTDDSILHDLLASMKSEELKNMSIEDQPALFPLGAVVCVLDSYKSTMNLAEQVIKRNKELQQSLARRHGNLRGN